jgi:hypothetical protein
MITLSCHCGAVGIETAKSPDFIHDCNCTLCAKSGARWGYFHPDEVAVTGATKGFRRTDKDEASAEIRFCPECGSTTHFVLTEGAIAKFGNTMMGVNMWLADEADLAGIELRFPDGRNWDGASAFGYVREAQVIGQLADFGQHEQR